MLGPGLLTRLPLPLRYRAGPGEVLSQQGVSKCPLCARRRCRFWGRCGFWGRPRGGKSQHVSPLLPPKPCLPPPSRAPSVEARPQRSQHRLEKKREGPGVSTRCWECVRLIEGSHQVVLPVRQTAQEAHLPERHTEAQRSQAVPRVTWERTWSLPSQGQPANTFQSLGQQ